MEPDDLVRAHTAQFICVLVSGILEKACSQLLAAHAARAASPRVARYASNRLKYLQNMSAPKIEELLRSFDPIWAKELEDFWAGQIRDAIVSLVNNRNQIAHGQHVGVSLAQAIQWTKDAKAFCDKLEQITTK